MLLFTGLWFRAIAAVTAMIFRNWPGQGTHTDIQWCETLQYRNFITDPIFRNRHLDCKLFEKGKDILCCISIHYFSYKCIMCLMLFCSLRASFKSIKCFFFTLHFVIFLYSQTAKFFAFVTFFFSPFLSFKFHFRLLWSWEEFWCKWHFLPPLWNLELRNKDTTVLL